MGRGRGAMPRGGEVPARTRCKRWRTAPAGPVRPHPAMTQTSRQTLRRSHPGRAWAGCLLRLWVLERGYIKHCEQLMSRVKTGGAYVTNLLF